MHRRVWGTSSFCPGRGRYVWNPKWQTIAVDPATGHPGERKIGPPAPAVLSTFANAHFGLEFEETRLAVRDGEPLARGRHAAVLTGEFSKGQ